MQIGQVPTVAYLTQLIRPCLAPYSGDHRSEFDALLSAQSRRKLELQQQAYEEKADEYCNAFANFLLKQWPYADPTLERLSQESSLLLNVAQAFEIIKPEWLRLFQKLANFLLKQWRLTNSHYNNAYPSAWCPSPSSRVNDDRRVLRLS
ncbi:hypothetical protein SLS55_001696 [Diplodia seriata]|uniref:Uncharacterized protein n=1 Tax=Diplodia seriata TaxID=420778 RepID=A0ABR3CQ17_9PEZI